MVRNCNKIKNLSIWVIQLFYDFIIAQWYFVTKVVLTFCKKKMFEITRAIYSKSERSEKFLVTECCLKLVPGGSSFLTKLEQLEFKLEKIIGI